MNDDQDYVITFSGQRALRSKTLGGASTSGVGTDAEPLIWLGSIFWFSIPFGITLALLFSR